MKRSISIPALILMFCLIFSACQKEPACEHQFTTKTEKEDRKKLKYLKNPKTTKGTTTPMTKAAFFCINRAEI